MRPPSALLRHGAPSGPVHDEEGDRGPARRAGAAVLRRLPYACRWCIWCGDAHPSRAPTMTPRLLLALLAFAPLPLLAQARRPVAQPLSVVAAAVCRGIPFPNAPPYDTSRPGIHMLAEPPTGTWPGRPTGMRFVRDSGAFARLHARRRSELELVLCFASEEVVVDTCRGYSTFGGFAPASDVVLAERRWSVRLLEARTGLVVDTLQLQVEGSPHCPRSLAASVTRYVVEVDGPEGSATLRDWVSRFVEPRSPGALARRSCDRGDMEGCFDLGAMYAEGRGVAQNDARAVEFYRRAVDLYRRACDNGIMQGCTSPGAAYDSLDGVARNLTRAVGLYQRACDGGNMQGCVDLGAMYSDGRGVAQDLTRAVVLHQRACDGGEMRGCVDLGLMYSGGRGVAQSDSLAVQLYQRACDGGHWRGCTFLGTAYFAGRGVTQSDRQAVQFYQLVCDRGYMGGCSGLGVMYTLGRGVEQNDVWAVVLFRRACDGGNMPGCSLLGEMYAVGRGVARSDSGAVQLFRRACDGGEMTGCTNLGLVNAGGRGVAQSDGRAVQLYERACNGGHMRGCAYLGAMYENGRGVAQDSARAAELYRRACDGGVGVACDQLRRASPGVRP